MSIHKSLKSESYKSKRTVRKRWERIRSLKLQKKFDSGQSVYGLPKEKIIKYKIKKEKKDEDKEKSLVEIAQDIKKDKAKKQSKDIGKIK